MAKKNAPAAEESGDVVVPASDVRVGSSRGAAHGDVDGEVIAGRLVPEQGNKCKHARSHSPATSTAHFLRNSCAFVMPRRNKALSGDARAPASACGLTRRCTNGSGDGR